MPFICPSPALVSTCCLVTSYEANGDLKSFLTQQGAVYMNTGGQSVTQQLNIARQVVEGCLYLAKQTQVLLVTAFSVPIAFHSTIFNERIYMMSLIKALM